MRQRVTDKVALLTNKVRTTATPTYLTELVQTHAPPRALHSSDAPLPVVSHIHSELARRAFSVIAAPSSWNSLPADIQLCENILTFKRHWKPICSNSASRPKDAMQIRYYYYYYYIIIIAAVVFMLCIVGT